MRFSIITCTYNSAGYLQENIESVKNQTFFDFEHIFIDGLSTDGTVAAIQRYQIEFPNRVRLFRSAPKGIANAMNEGIRRAKGEYIIHLHSDDAFFSNDVLNQVNQFILSQNNPALIYGKAKFVHEQTGSFRIIPHRNIYKKMRFWLLLLTNYIPHQSVFIKRKIFDNFGLFEEIYKNSMDYEFWLRLSKKGVSAAFLDKIICIFSVRSGSQSTINKRNDDHRRAYQKHLHSRILISILSFIDRLNKKRDIL